MKMIWYVILFLICGFVIWKSVLVIKQANYRQQQLIEIEKIRQEGKL